MPFDSLPSHCSCCIIVTSHFGSTGGGDAAAAYMARQRQEGSSNGMMGTILPVYAVGIFIYFGYVIYKVSLTASLPFKHSNHNFKCFILGVKVPLNFTQCMYIDMNIMPFHNCLKLIPWGCILSACSLVSGPKSGTVFQTISETLRLLIISRSC